MLTLAYLNPVKLVQLSKRFSLLSYALKHGDTTPRIVRQFVTVANTALRKIHDLGLVHADVRKGNIIFEEEAYLIDFDYTAGVGDKYPALYSPLPERHNLARSGAKKDYAPDWYSLIYIMMVYFRNFDNDIKGTTLWQPYQEHHISVLSSLN